MAIADFTGQQGELSFKVQHSTSGYHRGVPAATLPYTRIHTPLHTHTCIHIRTHAHTNRRVTRSESLLPSTQNGREERLEDSRAYFPWDSWTEYQMTCRRILFQPPVLMNWTTQQLRHVNNVLLCVSPPVATLCY